MMMTQEQLILKAQNQFDQVKTFIHQACSEDKRMDLVESDLWGRMLEVGRLLLGGYVAGYQQGDLGPTLEHQSRVLRRLEQPHVRRYVSVFGELEIPRYVYGTRETQKHEVIALDAILALPESEFSYVLQDWDQSFCVESSYGQSRRQIERILRIGQSVLSLEQMNGQMASATEGFWVTEPPPVSETEGPIMVLTADGKGVPMRREGDSGVRYPGPQPERADRFEHLALGRDSHVHGVPERHWSDWEPFPLAPDGTRPGGDRRHHRDCFRVDPAPVRAASERCQLSARTAQGCFAIRASLGERPSLSVKTR